MAYASTLTLEELDDDGNALRAVVLMGGGLPFWGAGWASSLQVSTSWYQGNDSATQQVLGPREMPSTWSGEWTRTILSRTPCKVREDGVESDVVSAMVLREAVETIHRSGRRIRATWAVTGATRDQSGKIVREGRLTSLSCKFRGIFDVEWEATFDWAGRGGPRKVPLSTREDSLFASTAAMLVQSDIALSGLTAQFDLSQKKNAKGLIKSPTSLSLGQLESIADLPNKTLKSILRPLQQQTSNLKRLLGIAQKVRGTPFELANSAVAFGQNSVAIVNQFADAMGRTPPELFTLKTRASDVTRSATYFGQKVDVFDIVARRARELAERFKKTTSPLEGVGAPQQGSETPGTEGRILAVYIVRDGDTALSLSMKFYGSPDRADDILRANKVQPYVVVLPRGKKLIIPALSQGPTVGRSSKTDSSTG